MKQTPSVYLKLTVIVILITVVISAFMCLETVMMFNAPHVDSKEANRRNVEYLLKVVQENSIAQFPQNGSESYIQITKRGLYAASDPQCWTYLHDAVVQNLNQYSLSTYDNGPRQLRDVDDSTVQIDYADGRRVKLVFYQGNLVACQTYVK